MAAGTLGGVGFAAWARPGTSARIARAAVRARARVPIAVLEKGITIASGA
jgi:hypothetical protein